MLHMQRLVVHDSISKCAPKKLNGLERAKIFRMVSFLFSPAPAVGRASSRASIAPAKEPWEPARCKSRGWCWNHLTPR